MKRLLPALLAAIAMPGLVIAGGICDGALYATSLCPWFGPAPEGFAAPKVGMRWSSDGYVPGSAVGRWNDGIYVIASLPQADSSGAASLWIDVAYEPHWQPHKARRLTPVAVTLQLGEDRWRAEARQPLPPLPDDIRRPEIFEGNLYRFAFDADVVAAMLEASLLSPQSYDDTLDGWPEGFLHFEILFRDAEGNFVAASDILDVGSGRCASCCQPRLSLAGFADAYRRSGAADE